jgi:ribosomal protein S18 acetylase RimI-like enzyme
MHPDSTPLFTAGPIQAKMLGAENVPALQTFFEDNPQYFLAVEGNAPHARAAREEFDDLPPPDMPFKQRWLIGLYNPAGQLVGFVGVLSDFLAAQVWHIGIFMIASALHGTGVALSLYRALESWMISNGAQWIRLGVVEGNARAEHFWRKAGYREVRQRTGIKMGSRCNTVRVLVKPLSNATMAQYKTMVARDRPDSPLA